MNLKFEKLKTLLRELFQLDQPDLDFGIYRILHLRSREVGKFLDEDLPNKVRLGFTELQSTDQVALQRELQQAIEQARGLGADPDALPKVRELKARMASEAGDTASLESEVYDHLYSFFSRYYSEGDFISNRRYGKNGDTAYVIPYAGEEVMLHWANKDQYYIKTSEYLRDYAFRLRPDDEKNPMRVHFRLMCATEGEHANIKAVEGKERVFVLAPAGESGQEFIGVEAGDLVVRFEYRPAQMSDWGAEGKDKTRPPVQKELLGLTTRRVLAVADSALAPWIDALKKEHVKSDGKKADYSRLEAHLLRYTARNTFDYFIHKDLSGFLTRELDFYIKNEVLHLEDLEKATTPGVRSYLSKIRLIRQIASDIIAFLAQIEDFQKRLWLKKKFVVETQYCITLDRIPESFYPEIAANDAQREEWVKLFAIQEIKGDLVTPGYSEPLTVEFLKAHPSLVLDTRHFTLSDFTPRLLNTIDDLDEQTDGVLIHSENFQALNLMREKYRERVKCIYIDPPYNTDASPIDYKNGYRRSSWTSLIEERIGISKHLLHKKGILCVTIDDYQQKELHFIIEYIFGRDGYAGTVSIRINPSGRPIPSGFAQSHEYAIFARNSSDAEISKLPRSEQQAARYRHQDDNGRYMWELFRKRGSGSEKKDRPSLYYPLYVKNERIRVPNMVWNEDAKEWRLIDTPEKDEIIVYPIDEQGVHRRWRGNPDNILSNPDNFIAKTENCTTTIYYKYKPASDGVLPLTVWADAKYSATEHGTGTLKNFFKEYSVFSYPKSIYAVCDCLVVSGLDNKEGVICDYFAGSGTTAHAVINLNREDGGRRKFILVEMANYFDTVLLPRIKKVTFTPEWQDGKPKRLATAEEAERGPRIVKVLRLESYEDTLNNLEDKLAQPSLFDGQHYPEAFREQYLLRYMLEMETRDSPSLLNVAAFTDPTAYRLRVKRPGSDESQELKVDLVETFNWLIGLTVNHIAAPQSYNAEFERDREEYRLRLKGTLKQVANGPWWFRTVEGNTRDGKKVLIIWRNRPGGETYEGIEQDNLVLNEWFAKQQHNTREKLIDLIYVNGDNNLENIRVTPSEGVHNFKVRLIEEHFKTLMCDVEER